MIILIAAILYFIAIKLITHYTKNNEVYADHSFDGNRTPNVSSATNTFQMSTPSAPVPQPAPVHHVLGPLGTAASVAGGVVAGQLIADSLLHRNHNQSSYDDQYEIIRRRTTEESIERDSGYSSPVSTDNERSSYSSSSSSSDDSWSSSDSGSSSSDW